jgi:hypothetical protein
LCTLYIIKMASAAVPQRGKYNLVAFIQAHGEVCKPPDQVETRQHGPNYDGITMTELSIPGDKFIPGLMGQMNWPDKVSPHWLGKSTESVIPGILRAAFMGTCDNPDNPDNPDNINRAFTGVIEKLKPVYAAANIQFPEGGFTVRVNPPDHQWWRLRRSWGENRRANIGEQPKREAADRYVPTASEAYGVFCVCSDHPSLQNLCLTSLKDENVSIETHEGKITSDFIAPKFFPIINMIGHDAVGGMLGAQNWIDAINTSNTNKDLQEKAIKIITKAWGDKSLYSQDLITVFQALDIGHVWLVNPTCRGLCEKNHDRGNRSPSPLRHDVPESVSPPRTRTRERTISPPPQQTSAGSGSRWPSLTSVGIGSWVSRWFTAPTASSGTGTGTGRGRGGSRKSRRKTTTTRRKITRKTKKTAYKRKSQKRYSRRK